MDAAQIAAMIADREAGTPGSWSVFVDDSGDRWTGWPLSVNCDVIADKTIVRTGGMWPYEWDAKTSQHEACANARRIARVPDMESTIIAQAAELERLRAERDVLRKVITEGRRAIGDHFAPHDCYATGPMTGDPIRDLVQCPACSFIAMHDTALKGGTQ